jgi:hypothetical protein
MTVFGKQDTHRRAIFDQRQRWLQQSGRHLGIEIPVSTAKKRLRFHRKLVRQIQQVLSQRTELHG